MKMNFSVSVDEQEMFINLYNIDNYDRLRNGGRIISMSKFFVELMMFYNENNKKEINKGVWNVNKIGSGDNL